METVNNISETKLKHVFQDSIYILFLKKHIKNIIWIYEQTTSINNFLYPYIVSYTLHLSNDHCIWIV